MQRTFSIEATSGDNTIHARVTINTEGLMRHEVERLKSAAADRIMHSLTGLPHFFPYISEMKVRR